ncbi:hypothetical protein [Roseibium aggregatum]|uniref:Uncharacterized protein n=1 Tax=Roseibium aggregatum TaxID=187304 RepID=A0A0M6YAV7_9HYPH|nr:hypothetical protein [Roseibium aggregatum]CTQ47226.1 hypothetical protein LAL4801_05688 [Roseibium aggregatum]
MEARIQPYAIPMLLLTATYLAVEVAFAGYLVDALSGFITHEDIGRIEVFGKLLSGTAVVIAYWGRLASKGSARRLGTYIRTAIFCLVVVYAALTGVNKAIVSLSSPEFRQQAYQAAFSRSVLKRGGETSKAYVAVAPALLMSSDTIARDLKVSETEMATIGTEAALGSVTEFRGAFFRKLDADRIYDRYREGVLEYQMEKAKIPYRKRKEWIEVKARQIKHSVPDTPGVKNAYFASRVVREIGQEYFRGGKWRTTDVQAFYRAIELRAHHDIEKEYRRRVEREVGAYLPPGLEKREFVMSKPVQERIREQMAFPVTVSISPWMSETDFEQHVYRQVLAQEAALAVRRFNASAQYFDDGRTLEEVGRNAVSVVVVPALAIVFSLLGSMFHLVKVSGYFHMVAGAAVTGSQLPRGIRNASAVFTALIVVAGLSMQASGSVPDGETGVTGAPVIEMPESALNGVLRASARAMDVIYPAAMTARISGPFALIDGSLPKSRGSSSLVREQGEGKDASGIPVPDPKPDSLRAGEGSSLRGIPLSKPSA